MRKPVLVSLWTWLLFVCNSEAQVVITGQLKKWHRVTLTFESGINTSETAIPNPFTEYRLNVTFTNGNKTYKVAGYYAADGNAANTSASSGSKWRVNFSPDEVGVWNYVVSFRKGSYVAVSDNPNAGSPVAPLNGITGSFVIQPTDKTGRDHRAKGRLQYIGRHHLRFAETGEYFLKKGCNSPENFLAYWEIDGTYDDGGVFINLPNELHAYPSHIADWRPGDPTWQGNKGKGIIGALNYLASEGVNALYFVTMNIAGDGQDVWPFISDNSADRERYDVSKLDQWEIIFSHMDSLGIMLHIVTQEYENQMLLDNGNLGNTRKLYYRELIARFSHHLAITWNLGEENGRNYPGRGAQNDQQRKDMATYFKTHDPYRHFVTVHTYTTQHDLIYRPLLGFPHIDGVSMQMNTTGVNDATIKWIDSSAAYGRKWVVCHDETVGGIDQDGPASNQGILREKILWANYMSGGGGIEWYFGNNDLDAEDFRKWSGAWYNNRSTHHFFMNYLPFWDMKSNDFLTPISSDFVLELPGKIYAVYLPSSGLSDKINLPCGSYTVKWYEPTNMTPLLDGSVTSLSGGNGVFYGSPPYSSEDWVVLITTNYKAAFDVINTGCDMRGGELTVHPSGGTAPYSYLWSTGEITQTISDLTAGFYTVTITDNNGCQLVDTAEVRQTGNVSMNLRVFLEGPYNAATGLMRDDLRAAELIPLSEPFTALGFTHRYPGGGETTTPAVLAVTGADAIVDWVFVELRSKSNRSVVVATRSGLLQRDGDIVEVNGSLPLAFPGTPCDEYYIAVRHRNHLGFMTQNVESFAFTLGLDLSNTSVPLYGTNAQKTVSGRRVMWAGNCNSDKMLKYTGSGNDRDFILSRVGGASAPVNSASGYFTEDVNMDGYVKYMGLNNDRDIILLNIGGTNPSATRTEQLP